MLTVDVISDVICPLCFIGKRRLEKALDNRAATVRWHPFQLNPDMPCEGIDRTEVEGLLAGDDGLDVVRAGEEQARRLGVSGLPFFVVNGKVALSGAQPPELFRQAFEQAGEAVVAGEACQVDPTTGKRGC
jgi:predicted DsbA family dithiol-disulfide isomerase